MEKVLISERECCNMLNSCTDNFAIVRIFDMFVGEGCSYEEGPAGREGLLFLLLVVSLQRKCLHIELDSSYTHMQLFLFVSSVM